MDPDAIVDSIFLALKHELDIAEKSDFMLTGSDGQLRNGYYWERNGTHHVWIRKALRGTARLATLVHELGHYQSARYHGRSEVYQRAIEGEPRTWVDRSLEERRAVLAEELRAWQLGLEIARKHGLDDTSDFLEHARAGFTEYRDRVALPIAEFEAALNSLGSRGHER